VNVTNLRHGPGDAVSDRDTLSALSGGRFVFGIARSSRSGSACGIGSPTWSAALSPATRWTPSRRRSSCEKLWAAVAGDHSGSPLPGARVERRPSGASVWIGSVVQEPGRDRSAADGWLPDSRGLAQHALSESRPVIDEAAASAAATRTRSHVFNCRRITDSAGGRAVRTASGSAVVEQWLRS